MKKSNFLKFYNSEIYYEKALSLPMHPGISTKQVKMISNAIESYLKK